MASKQDIQEIKARLDIVTVVEKYVQLKKTGRTWIGLCPFHNEKTPSFHVNPQIGIYKCFGCGKFGDIFQFIQDIERVDFPDAIEKLASQAGIVLAQDVNNVEYKKAGRVKEMTKLASDLYNYLLTKHPSGKDALEYARNKRKLTDETIEQYKIGFAPMRFDTIKSYLAKKGFTNEEMLSAGLLNDKGVDKFVNRLVFSLFDASGHVIGFSGRVFVPGDERPKYLNSPETLIFKKRMSLFGLFTAKEEMAKKDMAILCEGQIDVISSQQSGVKNIAAPLGTALTDAQLMILSKFTKNIAFCFDNDTAGQNSTVRGVEMALGVGLKPFILQVPLPYKDIDELVQADPEKWRQITEKPVDYFESKINELALLMKSDFPAFEKKLSELLKTVQFASELKRALLLKDISQRLTIDEASLRSALSSTQPFVVKQEGIQQRQGALTTADYILSLVLNFPFLVLLIGDFEKSQSLFSNEQHKKLYIALATFANPYKDSVMPVKKSELTVKGWLQRNTEFQTLIKDSYTTYIQQAQNDDTDIAEVVARLGISADTQVIDFSDDIVKDFLHAVRRLKEQSLTAEIQAIQAEIFEAEQSDDEQKINDLTDKIEKMRSQRKKFEMK